MKPIAIFFFFSLTIATPVGILLSMPTIKSVPTAATFNKTVLPAPKMLPSPQLAAPINDLIPATPRLNARADRDTIPSDGSVDIYTSIICETTRSAFTRQAATKRIDQGIKYLYRTASSGKLGPTFSVDGISVGRISCSWNSGIFIVNVNEKKGSLLMREDTIRQDPEPNKITFLQAANVAKNIREKCGDIYRQTNGELMDIHSGLIVVIAETVCTEGDSLNDLVY